MLWYSLIIIIVFLSLCMILIDPQHAPIVKAINILSSIYLYDLYIGLCLCVSYVAL